METAIDLIFSTDCKTTNLSQGWELQIEKSAEICRGPGAA
jgi:hypothetical protein